METPCTESSSHKEPVRRRTSVYTGMYTETDGLRLAGEIFLLRRIEKDRIISEQLEAKQRKNSF